MLLMAEVCKLPFVSRRLTPVPTGNFQYLHFPVASPCSQRAEWRDGARPVFFRGKLFVILHSSNNKVSHIPFLFQQVPHADLGVHGSAAWLRNVPGDLRGGPGGGQSLHSPSVTAADVIRACKTPQTNSYFLENSKKKKKEKS